MRIEYKTSGVQSLVDEGDGVVTAFVSVTGIEDNVKDNIHTGSYTETLTKRRPKGVWSHDWTQPIAKTLEAKELKPGDKGLPSKLANGDAWPKEAGALCIKMKFNTKSKRGLQAYQDVTFFGPEQEWSIGYRVKEGQFWVDEKTGVRHIEAVDLFEYSPVLFGAMSHARTVAGKSDVATAQLQYKSLTHQMNTEQIDGMWEKLDEYRKTIAGAMEFKDDGDGADFLGDEFAEDTSVEVEDIEVEDIDPEDVEDADDDGSDDLDDEEGKSLNIDDVRAGIKALEGLLASMTDSTDQKTVEEMTSLVDVGGAAYIEAKATEHATALDAVDQINMPDLANSEELGELRQSAQNFDDAVNNGDTTGAEKAAEEMLPILEKFISSEGDEGDGDVDSIRAVSRVITDNLDTLMSKDTGEESSETAPDDETAEGEGKSYLHNGVQYKLFPFGSRQFGQIRADQSDVKISGAEARRIFIGTLDDYPLLALHEYATLVKDTDVLGDTKDEMNIRTYLGTDFKTCGTSGAVKKPKEKIVPKKKPVKKPGASKSNPAKVDTKRAFNAEQLRKLGERGMAFENASGEWSYPVETIGDLDNAIRAWGRSVDSDRDSLKAYLLKRAKALKANQSFIDRINNLTGSKKAEPQSGETYVLDLTEFKSYADLLGDPDLTG